MAEGEPNDKPQPEGKPSEPSGEPGEIPRRRFLTPEQRRLLGDAPTRSDRPRSSLQAADQTSAAGPVSSGGGVEGGAAATHPILPQEEALTEPAPHSASVMRRDEKSSRVFEMQKVAIIIGCLFLLGSVFYLGTRVPYWLYRYRSHQAQKQVQSVPDKFPGVSSDDLVEQAIAAQEAGRWPEAAFRSRIAVRRHDYAAAERFSEAAAVAAPFLWSNYYQWAEVLRLNHHSREAIRRYEQAARRAPPGLNAIVCSYKARLGRIEAWDPKVGEEIARRQSEGSLSAEWLLTAAALKIDQGHFGDALQLLTEARAATTADTFSYFVNDPIFQNATQSDPAIAAIFPTSSPASPLSP